MTNNEAYREVIRVFIERLRAEKHILKLYPGKVEEEKVKEATFLLKSVLANRPQPINSMYELASLFVDKGVAVRDVTKGMFIKLAGFTKGEARDFYTRVYTGGDQIEQVLKKIDDIFDRFTYLNGIDDLALEKRKQRLKWLCAKTKDNEFYL